jgi:hypothetical protein
MSLDLTAYNEVTTFISRILLSEHAEVDAEGREWFSRIAAELDGNSLFAFTQWVRWLDGRSGDRPNLPVTPSMVALFEEAWQYSQKGILLAAGRRKVDLSALRDSAFEKIFVPEARSMRLAS